MINTADVFRIQLYGISEREKRDDDIQAPLKLKVQVWKSAFLGYRILDYRRKL